MLTKLATMLIFVGIFLLVLFNPNIPSAIAATPTFSPIERVSSTGGPSSNPQLAIDRLGTLHAVWTEVDWSAQNPTTQTWYASKPLGGAWSAATKLSFAGDTSELLTGIATDSDSTVHIVWSTTQKIYYTSKPVGGIWSDPIDLRNNIAGTERTGGAGLHIDSKDTLHVDWRDSSPGKYSAFYTFKPKVSGWSAPQSIVESMCGVAPGGKFIDQNDTLYLAYPDCEAPGLPSNSLFYVYKPIGGTWSTRQPIAPPFHGFPAYIFRDNQGTIHALVSHNTPDTGRESINYTHTLPDGTWSSPQDLVGNPNTSYIMVGAAFNNDTIHLFYFQTASDLPETLFYTSKALGSPWSVPVAIPTVAAGVGPVGIAIGPDQRLHINWGDNPVGPRHIWYRSISINNSPTIELSGDSSANEGDTKTYSFTVSDPDPGDTFTVKSGFPDCGTGGVLVLGSLTTDSNGGSFQCRFPDGPASPIVRMQVMDSQNTNSNIASAAVSVSNKPPEVGSISIDVNPVQVNTPVNADANFTDPGVLDTHTAVWDWGNATSAGNVTETSGSGSATGSHSYTTPGVYTLTLTVTDKDGGSGQSIFQYVVVYDPNGGFVTGAGTINSPAGAYTLNPSLSGKAIFGFVSKYQQGATTPTGNTQFRFQAAGLNFQSTSYDWLVVSGARGQFKGTGAISGNPGNFGFMLTAIDGQVNGGGNQDKFRIKIWDRGQSSDGSSGVIYDNQIGASDTSDPTTVISSGSITIQK
ncbi:PKD domain-containing protein [Candidatus Daviesbacteria bacterium]|nr:PKD domain-containing protein [Candidatus Daviesbacteria bacterium]